MTPNEGGLVEYGHGSLVQHGNPLEYKKHQHRNIHDYNSLSTIETHMHRQQIYETPMPSRSRN